MVVNFSKKSNVKVKYIFTHYNVYLTVFSEDIKLLSSLYFSEAKYFLSHQIHKKLRPS